MLKRLLIQQQQPVLAEENMSNLTSASGEASVSSGNCPADQNGDYFQQSSSPSAAPPAKRRRNLPGNPDPGAEVVALSPKSLMATNRFVCEICNKGFQRDQNLQLHRRGHNLPWKLRRRASKEATKRVYVCPEPSCVHHDPSRALGDLTGIKKHYCRKHGEKKWSCQKCSKRYAVQSDWKAHSKTCGTREYRCDCGTTFSRRDSFVTHRAFCDALAEESAKAYGSDHTNQLQPQFADHYLINSTTADSSGVLPGLSLEKKPQQQQQQLQQQQFNDLSLELPPWLSYPSTTGACPIPPVQYIPTSPTQISKMGNQHSSPQFFSHSQVSIPHENPSTPSSATALLHRAAQMGAAMSQFSCSSSALGPHQGHMSGSCGSGLGFCPSREDEAMESSFVYGLTAFGHKAATLMDQTATAPPSAAAAAAAAAAAPSLHQNMMMEEGSYHEETYEGLLLGSSNQRESGHDQNFETSGSSGIKTEKGASRDSINGGFTRDFLGLRGFSQRDMILNMAVFEPCLNNPSSPYEKNQNTWRP